jgi:hypothetical protein
MLSHPKSFARFLKTGKKLESIPSQNCLEWIRNLEISIGGLSGRWIIIRLIWISDDLLCTGECHWTMTGVTFSMIVQHASCAH